MQQNFVCIGAQKAGTTTLADILSAHPDICIPPIKETKFFLFPEDYAKGKSFYDTYFSNYSGQKAIGEFDPDYLLFPDTAIRMWETLGKQLKLIVVIRHPADRAYSHYLMTKRKGLEPLTFEEALAAEHDRKGDLKTRKIYGYVERGLYGRQLEAFLRIFPAANFLFLEFERDLIKGRPEMVRRVQAFLQVPVVELPLDVHSNEAGEPVSEAVNELVRKPNFVKRMFKVILPMRALRKWLRKRFIRTNMQKASAPRLDDTVRRELVNQYFREDIIHTEKLTGMDLSSWYK